MPRIINIAGQTFGRLTVLGIARHGKYPGDKIRWRCRCSCGGETLATARNLRNGHTKSCGCWRSDISRQLHTVHGGAPRGNRARLHGIWAGIKTRCTNPRCAAFPRYGGRGIRVCAEWDEFEPFRDWAHANGYADHLTIDRIDNDGNYEPANCRWATYSEQSRNNPQNRAVIRSDGKRFALVVDGARETQTTTSAIAAAIKRGRKCAGYYWKYDE
jgi:hypothetical protein